MKLNGRFGRAVLPLATLVALAMLGGVASAADKYRVIYDFGQKSSDGWDPVGLLALAKNGDFYGVTESGGTDNLGTFYKLIAPRTRGGVWAKTILYDFPGGKGGGYPTSLVLGKDGNLYGADYTQTIFELRAPTSDDSAWEYAALYTLNGDNDGSVVEQDLAFDAEGNLYGATELGGDVDCGQDGGCGTVFELKRPGKEGGRWRFSVLHTFTGSPDGAQPFAGVVFGQSGDLYGTTSAGGASGDGAAYRLSPPARKGRPWTETVLYSFDRSNNGANSPGSPLIFDSLGNMYGTTSGVGDPNCQGGFGCGVVFELSPPTKKGQAWAYAALHAFQGGDDGAIPSGYMVFDSKGNLYGTTEVAGEAQGGTVYQLKPPGHKDGAWTETVLHGFNPSDGDGDLPESGLTWGKWNDLYGVTAEGGLCQYCGTAFALEP
jgi:uncharacterized repeat protein (TIGR03803 family)